MGKNPWGVPIEFNAYNDFDAFSRNVYYINGRMLLKDPQHQAWANSHIELCGLHLQIGSLGSGSIVEGTSSSDGYLVYVPLSKFRQHVANGTVLKDNSILILEPGSDFCLSVRGPHEGCLIYVPKQKLRRLSKHRLPPTNGGRPGCRIIPVTRKLAGELRSFIHETASAAAVSSKFEFSQEAKNSAAIAVGLVSAIILEGQCSDFQSDGRPRISRQKIMGRCNELLEERGPHYITVGQMASRAAVSERTLQTAFKEYYGVGPTRYLQLRHLRQINIALQSAQPNMNTVTEILLRHGEWQFGRFAQRYRNLFGELPSQTLQRQRG